MFFPPSFFGRFCVLRRPSRHICFVETSTVHGVWTDTYECGALDLHNIFGGKMVRTRSDDKCHDRSSLTFPCRAACVLSLGSPTAQGIRIIKLFAWEKDFVSKIDKSRHDEMRSLRGYMVSFWRCGVFVLFGGLLCF